MPAIRKHKDNSMTMIHRQGNWRKGNWGIRCHTGPERGVVRKKAPMNAKIRKRFESARFSIADDFRDNSKIKRKKNASRMTVMYRKRKKSSNEGARESNKNIPA